MKHPLPGPNEVLTECISLSHMVKEDVEFFDEKLKTGRDDYERDEKSC